MKNDIYKNNLKNLSWVTLLTIPRYTYVPNMDTLSQTMPKKWSYPGRLTWNPYIFIDDRRFCEVIFCKVWQKSCLLFFLSTSTHKRTPCQRISFFEIFFILFELFEKMVKMINKAICRKKSIFPKLWMVLWNHHYLCTLNYFWKKFRANYHTLVVQFWITFEKSA